MVSTRLIQMIEDHAEELTRGLIQQLKTHPHTPAFRRFPEAEIHNRTYNVYKNLGAWILGKPRDEIRRQYEDLGTQRCAEGVPLHEVLYALILSKKNLLIHVKNSGQGGSAIEIYGEQELVNKVDQFYDDAIYFTAVGYESALTALKASAASTRRA